MTDAKFSRRALLESTALVIGVAVTCGLPHEAAAQEKVAKTEAKYQVQPKGQQRCEICLQFQPPNSCKLVEGAIYPKGWCQFFAAKENAH